MKRITIALLVFFALGITAQAQTTEKEAPKASTSLTAKKDKKAVKAEKTAKVTPKNTVASDKKAKKCCASMAEAKEKGCVESYTPSCSDKKSAKSCCAAKAEKSAKTEKKPEKETEKDS